MEAEKKSRLRLGIIAAVLVLLPVLAIGTAAADDTHSLIPVGHTVGIRLDVDGVIVVKLRETQSGGSPARQAGLKEGDIIKSVNGMAVSSAAEFAELAATGECVTLGLERKGEYTELEIDPDGGELGIWVRDSIAGIGTVTYYDAEDGSFGALGHGINDLETGVLLPLRDGAVMYSVVGSVTAGVNGEPGELHGSFDFDDEIGTLCSNTEYGVFGVMDGDAMCLGEALETAELSELHTGAAEILANIDGDGVESYSVNITHIAQNAGEALHSMTLEITDERLIERTGGIAQGMSGCPILQDGKLAGAVTHVLVSDPRRGYGISIQAMLNAA